MSDWAIAWRLARRELDWRFRGLRLLLVCLVLGVGALAAIGSLSQAIGRELAARGAVILGGDVEFGISQRAATSAERADMARLGRVSETVRMQSSAVAGSTADPTVVPIELKGVDAAYPLYGRLEASGPSGARDAAGVWIAPALAERLGAAIGDRIRLGGAAFVVRGIVANEPDRLGEGFTLGPVALISLEGLARTGLIQPGSLYERKYRVRLAGGNPPAVAAAWKRARPEAGWEVRTRDRAAPGASRFVERMGEFLALVGLSALVIAGIGIANGVGSYLAARRRGIAMFKVMGATGATVTRIYLLQVAVVAGIGIALGLVIGVVAVPLIGWAARDVLPVAPGFTLEAGPLALAGLYGALVALAAAAPPLTAAAHTRAAGLLRGAVEAEAPPRRSLVWWVGVPLAVVVALAMATSAQPWLAGGFLLAVAGALALLALFGWAIRRGAARLPRSHRPLVRLAVSGLYRPGARTVALVVALGLGLTLFVLLAAIRSSLDANIARTVPARAPALFALDVPRDREAEFRRIVRTAAPRGEVRTVPVLRGTITAYGTTRVADMRTIPEGAWALRGERGLTYAAQIPAGSTLTAGRWWPADYAGPRLVSVDERLAKALNLRLGDSLSVSVLGVERTARVASFRRIDWDTLGFNFVLVFSPNTLADAPHNLAATVELPPGGEGPVIRALLRPFPSVSVIEVRGVLAQLGTLVGQMATAIGAAAGVTVLAGVAVLVGAIAAAREARTYDAVVLRTLGMTRAQLLTAQALEYALLSGAVALLALALGAGGAWYVVTQLFEFVWLPSWPLVLGTLAAGVAVTMALGLAGAWPLLGVRPAAALRQV
ncbi:ABC transporter permease [Sphingomonas sp.]|jgi:putative ABC transport system permease protein|uniref:ABC transporter permease n=1 Tax=Sphingomonas sp. TaxID=28214 RepID=UPI002D806334|nr:FtsX-like permease family protein [Sphingomonas sp.]HEU0043275.1 FtsX-like permease family protein [Sphingomonas sp.]